MEEIRLGICRLCAIEKQVSVEIFDHDGYRKDVVMKVKKYLHVEINENDSLPSCLCWDCYLKLETCGNFIETCHAAQVILNQNLQSVYNEFPIEKETVQDTSRYFNLDQSNLSHSNQQVNVNSECNIQVANYFSENKNCNVVLEDSELTNNINGNRRKCSIPARYSDANVITIEQKRKTTKKRKVTENSKIKKGNSLANPLWQTKYFEAEEFKKKYFNQLPWMCTDCDLNFFSLQLLEIHHETNHNQRLRLMCPYCYKVYQYQHYNKFTLHIIKHETVEECTCNECGKVFVNKAVLQRHIGVHSQERPFKCKQCDKSFKQLSSLHGHIKCHIPQDERYEYVCEICKKRFPTKANLETHKKIHGGMKNYTCDQCGWNFVQKGNLLSHMLTHKTQKPFMCHVCNKEFKSVVQLRKHGTVHTGDRPYQCDVCGQTFREIGTLRGHRRVHTGDMPYTCEFCGRHFRFKGVLTTHRRQHTGEKPYSCIQCQHNFTNWSNYHKHMKRKHGVNVSRTQRVKKDDTPQPMIENTENKVEAFMDMNLNPTMENDHDMFAQQTVYQHSKIMNGYYDIDAQDMITQQNGYAELDHTI